MEATQWFRNGDHPFDGSKPVDTSGPSTTLTEGKVVQFFRRLHIPGDRICQECGNVMHKHGIIVGLNQQEETVHPGDYIVTDPKGRFYRRSAVEFEAMFELYPDPHDLTNTRIVTFEQVGENVGKPEPTIPDPGQRQ